jgi:O-antigen/teichoic acid export membrane protein
MAITAARYFRSQVPLFATTAGTLAIACYVLIPEEGLHGAAVAMILTGVLRCLLCFAILIYALKQPIRPVISPSA